ncbi:RNA-binding protein 2-like isoform X1 [Juglans regia]|uniref:RNA-binding protein 2-like isoform X1 n=1 Tax=Juglans regia TaxID=51240 RepID=A0A6P9EBP9_JUGRE|nr:RNA-binding protein 2-like isoform X1 [Juglans regia]
MGTGVGSSSIFSPRSVCLNGLALTTTSSSISELPSSVFSNVVELAPSVLPSAHEMPNYLVRDDDRGGPHAVKDTKSIGSAYDRYLQSAQLSSFTSGEASTLRGVGLGRVSGGGMPGPAMADPAVLGHTGIVGPDLAPNGRNVGIGNQLPLDATRPGRETQPLPPDASSTLYVEGLPPDSKKREVAHIFRPFVGYKEVRLVTKESKHRGGDPLILCFVDFVNPACAATAMSALQGYKTDDNDPDSSYLRLQFSRYPGPRSGSGSRGKR